MSQLILVSTLYGAATAVAAIESGVLGATSRRILLVANTAVAPEIAESVDEMPGFEALRPHFVSIHSYNATIAPFHPSEWRPEAADSVILERELRRRWDVEDDVDLVVESIQVPPALALAALFRTSRITVYADGLMTYGPTRTRIGTETADRIQAIAYPDLVPGLRPVLLREYDVPLRPFAVARLRAVFDRVCSEIESERLGVLDGRPPAALVVGQYLAELGLLSPAAERALHQRLIRAARVAHSGPVWFKAHPSANSSATAALAAWASGEGIELTLTDPTVPVEAILDRTPPAFVVGCFSTALITATRLYGVPAATVGAGDLLSALHPYENSNRIPITICAEVLPDLERTRRAPSLPQLDPQRVAADVQPLVEAVAFCMQPAWQPEHARATAAWLTANVHGDAGRYFARPRLTSLALPGGVWIPLWRSLPESMRTRARRKVGRVRRQARGLARYASLVRKAI